MYFEIWNVSSDEKLAVTDLSSIENFSSVVYEPLDNNKIRIKNPFYFFASRKTLSRLKRMDEYIILKPVLKKKGTHFTGEISHWIYKKRGTTVKIWNT